MPQARVFAILLMKVRGGLSSSAPNLLAVQHPIREASIVAGQYDLIAVVEGEDLRDLGGRVMPIKYERLRVWDGEKVELRKIHSCEDWVAESLIPGDDPAAILEEVASLEARHRRHVRAYVLVYYGKAAETALKEASSSEGTRKTFWKFLKERLKPAWLVSAYRLRNRSRLLIQIGAPDARQLMDAIMRAFQQPDGAPLPAPKGDELSRADERVRLPDALRKPAMATETLQVVEGPDPVEPLTHLAALAKAHGTKVPISRSSAAKAWGLQEDRQSRGAYNRLKDLQAWGWVEQGYQEVLEAGSKKPKRRTRVFWRFTGKGLTILGDTLSDRAAGDTAGDDPTMESRAPPDSR